jgi:hypothetical protein
MAPPIDDENSHPAGREDPRQQAAGKTASVDWNS